jgi:DNA polymerase elongation subunit (family B)
MFIAFDIETMPNPDAIPLLPEPFPAIGNLKDPEKIAAKIAGAKQEQIDRMALSPLTGMIASAAYYHPDKEDVIFGEAEIIERVLHIIRKGHTLVTFNGKGFDIPFVFKRGIILGVAGYTIPAMKRLTDKYRAVHHIDVMDEFCNFGERVSLDMCSRFILGEKKLDCDFRLIPEMLKTLEGQTDLSAYNLQDAKLTYKLAERMGLLDE